MEDGGLEGWRAGGVEGWRAGGLVGWRAGGLVGWRAGGLEGWRAEVMNKNRGITLFHYSATPLLQHSVVAHGYVL
jgi:hypothetical protein